MNTKNIAQTIDHTLLKPTATKDQIINLCKEAKKYHFKSVCIPPFYLPLAQKELKESDVLLCTVIGFPLGYNSTQTKLSECLDVLEMGAHEVDMVINIGALKDKEESYLFNEISQLRELCHKHDAILKVIIETSELDDIEKKLICEICMRANVDFVKTSTGFSSSGAKLEDIKKMRSWLPTHIKIKASGGIKTLSQVQAFLEAGADRLGMSAGVSVMESLSDS